MNNFGGDWTEKKIEILVEYAKAYLSIMNKYADKYNWELLYFDGFAGSGFIKKGKGEKEKLIVGAAKRILQIEEPRPFDMYYFVEKEEKNLKSLREHTTEEFPEKRIHIVNTDCNEKIQSMAKFLKTKKGKKYRVLAYIDPCGMQLNWDSLIELEKLQVDLWVLIPTGMGVNRLLKTNGDISEAWIEKLEIFLGMEREEILEKFYKSRKVPTLFGEDLIIKKEEKAIEISADLYKKRLQKLFEYVSKPYILKNKNNSTMFHFLMASNNKSALSIANDIIKKYNLIN